MKIHAGSVLPLPPSEGLAKSSVRAFIPAFVTLTGSHAAAVVLSQIMYWHHGRLKVSRKGVLWLVKSRAEMCEETGVSLDQYKRIIPKLIALNLIVTERGLFRNKITPFIRLTPLGFQLLAEHFGKSKGLEQKSTIQLVQGCANPLVQDTTNPITRIITESTTPRSGVEDDARAGKDLPEQAGGDPDSEWGDRRREDRRQQGRRENDMKASDILKQREDSPSGSLFAFWQRRMALIAGGYQKPLTHKEAGQLKQLQKYLQEQTREVIDFALNDWPKFVARVAAEQGTSTPTQPVIGFLLKYHATAVNMMKEKTETPETPVQLIATKESPPVIPAVEKEPVYVPSAEELEKLLAGLE